MRQAPHHGVAGRALAAAASAPLVRFQDPAGQDRLLGLEALTDDVKTELVETIAQRTDISKKDVLAVLDTFEDIVGDIVAKGKEVLTIPGFLKFEQTARAARTGRNPRTGAAVPVAGKAVPYFKPGKELRERINGATAAAAPGQKAAPSAAPAAAAARTPATVE